MEDKLELKLDQILLVLSEIRDLLQTNKKRGARGGAIFDDEEIAAPHNAISRLNTPTQKKGRAPTSEDGKTASLFVAAMVGAYSARYKTRPIISGQILGHIKLMLKHTTLPRLTNLYQAFLQLEDPWFKTKMHDFETFRQNLQKVQVALDTGGALGREKTWQEIAHEQEEKENGPAVLRITD